jgi:deoxyribose-phosphate aldolase
MVINIGALKSGELRVVERDVEAVTLPCRGRRAHSAKVIIEAALLTDDEKITALHARQGSGADYVKTIYRVWSRRRDRG